MLLALPPVELMVLYVFDISKLLSHSIYYWRIHCHFTFRTPTLAEDNDLTLQSLAAREDIIPAEFLLKTSAAF